MPVRRPSVNPSVRPPVSILRLALLAAILATVTPTAFGQGTGRGFPDPIDSDGLATIARRLDLSDAQRGALDLEHAAYLERFRTLRAGDVAAYLERTGDVNRSLLYVADPDELRRNAQQVAAILDRIRALDDTFFDALRDVLTDEQTERLVRVRQARARERTRSGIVRTVGFSNRGAIVDLVSLAAPHAPDDETRAALEPVLDACVAELDSGLRRLEDLVFAALRDSARRAERLADGAGGARRWSRGTMREALAAEGEPVFAQAFVLSQLNLRTGRQIVALLPAERRVPFRDDWYAAAWPRVASKLFTVVRDHDTLIASDALGDETRSAIVALRDDLLGQVLRLSDEMIDIEESTAREATWYGLRRGRGAGSQRFAELARERDRINDEARARLDATLGGTLDELLRSAADRARTDGVKPAATVRPGAATGRVPRSAPSRRAPATPSAPPGADPWLPGPIPRGTIAEWADRLALPDDARALLETLHDDYRERWKATEALHVPEIASYASTAWSIDPETRRLVPPTPKAVERVFARRSTAFAALVAIDAALFDDIALVVVDETDAPRVERLRGERLRAVLASRPEPGQSIGGVGRRGGRGAGAATCRACTIDLERLVRDLDLADPVRADVAPVLDAWSDAAIDALRSRRAAALEAEALLELIAGLTAQRGNTAERATLAAAIQQQSARMDQATAAVDAAEAALAALHERTLETLRAALPDDATEALDRADRHATHPEVFDDPGSAERTLRAALALDDLGREQRLEVSELLLSFTEPYATLCAQLVETIEGREALRRSGGRDWQRDRALANEDDRLRFERTELSRRTLRRLRAILAPEQASRLGLADEADGGGDDR